MNFADTVLCSPWELTADEIDKVLSGNTAGGKTLAATTAPSSRPAPEGPARGGSRTMGSRGPRRERKQRKPRAPRAPRQHRRGPAV